MEDLRAFNGQAQLKNIGGTPAGNYFVVVKLEDGGGLSAPIYPGGQGINVSISV